MSFLCQYHKNFHLRFHTIYLYQVCLEQAILQKALSGSIQSKFFMSNYNAEICKFNSRLYLPWTKEEINKNNQWNINCHQKRIYLNIYDLITYFLNQHKHGKHHILKTTGIFDDWKIIQEFTKLKNVKYIF